MGFNHFVNKFAKGVRMFRDVVRSGALEVRREGDRLFFEKNPSRVSNTVVRDFIARASRTADLIEVVLLGSVISEGPKIFRPRQVDFEMLEQTALNISFSDYVQPFTTLVIELPENYVAERRVSSPPAGQWLYGQQQPPTSAPVMVVVQHRPDLGLVYTSVLFDSDVSVKSSLTFRGDETIEDYLGTFSRDEEFANSLETSDEEWELVKSVIRASLNYCLLVDELGAKQIGPDNPHHHKRLESHVQKAWKSKDAARIRRAEDDLDSHPIIYDLDQHVRLYRTVASHSELGEGSGQERPPHHRRGHYSMQACGAGRSERRRVRIAPVFVNSHLFLGDRSDARATYT